MTNWKQVDVDNLYPFFATKRAAKGFWKAIEAIAAEQQFAEQEIKRNFGKREASALGRDFLKESFVVFAGTAMRRKLKRVARETRRLAVQP